MIAIPNRQQLALAAPALAKAGEPWIIPCEVTTDEVPNKPLEAGQDPQGCARSISGSFPSSISRSRGWAASPNPGTPGQGTNRAQPHSARKFGIRSGRKGHLGGSEIES